MGIPDKYRDGRAPQGACGLKDLLHLNQNHKSKSGSARSLWIESPASTLPLDVSVVGLRKEPVD